MLCYVVMCVFMFCSVMLCYVMSCHIMNHAYVAILESARLRTAHDGHNIGISVCFDDDGKHPQPQVNIILYYITETSHHDTTHLITSHYITPYHITYHITSHRILSISYHIICFHHLSTSCRVLPSLSLYKHHNLL